MVICFNVLKIGEKSFSLVKKKIKEFQVLDNRHIPPSNFPRFTPSYPNDEHNHNIPESFLKFY